jgi:hypothetical protein
MGDFVRHRFESVHDVLLERAGERLGTIRVNAEIHLRESWAHLEDDGSRPAERAGPHNRRIIADTTGHSVYGTGWGANPDEPLPEPIPQLVAVLQEHGGLEGIPFTDERFPEAFAGHVESTHGLVASFREVREGSL